ncbi:DUF4265 domain-containing protein [Streptomyces vilmorinianum]|uniref:DUF4265 domain-containing protein n=1 Tax=Streptomyces vilmorinianum TaxID=3051092 RepID=UPI0010FB0A33|nr:DUF4265 domain-containing protein [Streptomyces vilmorinianum]
MTEGRIKVWFRFVPREGWLPQDTEGLWATPVGPDTARVDNVPFLQDGVAQGDVVRYTTDAEGVHWAAARTTASGNCTLRVLPVPAGPLGPNAKAVHDRLSPFGLGGESFSTDFPLVALNVPADAPFARIKELLARGEDEGWWHWEMGCRTEAWEAA